MVFFRINKKTPPRKARSDEDYSTNHEIRNTPKESDKGLR